MLYSEYLVGAFHDHGASGFDADIYSVLERLYNANNAITKPEIYKAGKELHDVIDAYIRKHDMLLCEDITACIIKTFREGV